MHASRRYPRDLPAVPDARSFAAEVVEHDGGVPTDDLLLVVSELVTNAVMHGAGTLEVRIDVAHHHARVEVLDDGGAAVPDPPTRPPPEALGGRGLHLVRCASQAWGTGLDHRGRTLVWAEVPVDRAPADVRAGAGR